MANLEKSILTVTDPTIELDELSIVDRESDDSENKTTFKPSKFLGRIIPYCKINNMEFSISEIMYFDLDVNGFLPTLRIRIKDRSTQFISNHFPKDGDVIQFIIRSGSDKSYKDIRIDFDILSCEPGLTKSATASTFFITGQMKIPDLLTEFCETFGEKSSFDTLLDISQKLELGFASNETDTDDIMKWINPFDTRLKWIKDITANSYKDDDSFFYSYIDPFYYLTFININKIFSTEEDSDDAESFTINPVDGIEEDREAELTKQFFTNHHQFGGSSKFVSGLRPFNNSGKIFLSNGYKRFAQWVDLEDSSFNSEFVDPLVTKGTENDIHLKGRLIGEEKKSEGFNDRFYKYKYLGKQVNVDNQMHDNYHYSNVLNYQNNDEIFKMGLIFDIDIPDLSIYKYQRIPIFIYNYDTTGKTVTENREDDKSDDKSKVEGGTGAPTLDKFLSGFYVVYGINYIYENGKMKQRINTIRREFKQI